MLPPDKLFSDIEFLIALIGNAVLLLLQALRLYRTKAHRGLSITTFAGFLLIQLSGMVNGLYNGNFALIFGYGTSAVINLVVVILLVNYRIRSSSKKTL